MPSQPSVNRGTLILLAPNASDANISAKNVYLVFQFNPEKLLHTFNPPSEQTLGSADPQGAPIELFNLTFELDSVDIDPPVQNSSNLGVHPALAMLELMMQPQIVEKQMLMPIVVFTWGAKRSVPVRLVSVSVEEKAFDATLNPTRASVSLILRVLDATEVGNNLGAKNVCLKHQNERATLVDAYKLQTKQNPVTSASSNSLKAAAVENVKGTRKVA